MLILHKFHEKHNQGVMVWLQPPARRTIVIDHDHYFLSFPAMVFRLTYRRSVRGAFQGFASQSLRVAFLASSDKPREHSKVYLPSLYNVIGSGVDEDEYGLHCCNGRHEFAVTTDDLLKAALSTFWTTRFDSLGFEDSAFEEYRRRKYKTLGDYAAWQQKTKEKPGWIPKKMLPGGSYGEFLDLKNYEAPFGPEY